MQTIININRNKPTNVNMSGEKKIEKHFALRSDVARSMNMNPNSNDGVRLTIKQRVLNGVGFFSG